MDIRIQGEMDGTAAALVLRERFNIPVIYLTAHVDSATVARAKDAGPLGYITKPFQEAALHASIEIALHRHREETEGWRERGTAGFHPAGHLGGRDFHGSAEERSRSSIRRPKRGPAGPAGKRWDSRWSEVFQAVAGPSGDQIRKPWEQVLSDGSLQDLPAGARSGVAQRREAAHQRQCRSHSRSQRRRGGRGAGVWASERT